jgi:hypothetical protein
LNGDWWKEHLYLQVEDFILFMARPLKSSGEFLWNLKEMPNGNVQIWSVPFERPLRLLNAGDDLQDLRFTFEEDDEQPGECREFTLVYNSKEEGYTFSVPVGYPRAGANIALLADETVNGSKCTLTY